MFRRRPLPRRTVSATGGSAYLIDIPRKTSGASWGAQKACKTAAWPVFLIKT